MRNLIWPAVLLCTMACEPKLPSGVFACASDSDCPSDLHCARPGELSGGFCISRGQGMDMGDVMGTDAGKPPPPAPPPSGSFATVGGRRSNGSITVYDDGFEKGQRVCTNDKALCVTGGFEP